MDLNISLIKKIFSLIDIEIVIKNTKEIYEFRELLDAKKNSVYKTPIYNQVFNNYIKLLKKTGFKGYLVDSEKKLENALSFTNNKKNRKIPIFNISNKTGKGLNFLKDFVNELQPSGIWKQFVNEDESVMYIDCTYNVPGVGLVLSGTVTQGCIKRGQILFLGPYNHNNPFRRIVAKTLHNNVRQSVLELKSGDTGCIAIRGIKNIVKRDKITKGFIITSKEQPVTRKFIADIYILKTNRTSIRKGFEGTFYCRNVKCTARILQIHDKKNKEINCLRGGERAYVKLELLKGDRFLEPKSKIIFREGLVKAVGKVYKCL